MDSSLCARKGFYYSTTIYITVQGLFTNANQFSTTIYITNIDHTATIK